ncbi:hypothetical protein [Campylobacter sp. CNRCH_2015_0338h]|nr:hypothetical protein [Campylobacter sp. CNRCH_2015_0338h]
MSFLAIAHKSGKFSGIRSYSEIKNYPKLVNNQMAIHSRFSCNL